MKKDFSLVFTIHSFYESFQLLAFSVTNEMKDGILLQKKEKEKKRKLCISRENSKTLFANHWTNGDPSIIHLVVHVFHEHNLTFQKVFTRFYDIPLKNHCYKLYTEIYNEAFQR